MTKVTLLGDSIRLQYQPQVKALLGEDFEVYGPTDNCRFAKYTLRGLFDWTEDMRGSRIAHWNNGLWDICDLFDHGPFSSEEEYINNMLHIADILLERHDVVIFATTTPVSEKNRYDRNEHITRYNEIIIPKLKEKGVIINDLHSVIAVDVDRDICDDTTHLSEEGVALCAQKVAEVIKAAAGKLPAEKKEQAAKKEGDGAPVVLR